MTDSESPIDPVEALLAPVLGMAAEEREAAIEALCSAHPDLSEELRTRYAVAKSLLTASTEIERTGPRTTIGGYEIVRTLGGGGMGIVFQARQNKDGVERTVALKLIRHPAFLTPTGRERFRREARLAMSLDHPGLCPVIDYGEDDGTPYLAMRLIPGQNLADHLDALRRGEPATNAFGNAPTSASGSGSRRPFTDTVRLIEQLARAVHFAHERGMVHRDIKPGNVLLTAEGAPVLSDFGLARDLEDTDRLTVSEDPVGTPVYMAPEQVLGRRDLDRRADVYALGATLFECLTLSPPFAAPSRERLYQQILRGEHQPLRRAGERIPKDLESIVSVAMEPDPRRRYATAADLAEDLARYQRLEPIRARRSGVVLRLARWSQRNRAATVTLVVTVMALIAVSALLWSEREARRVALDNYGHAREAVRVLVEIARDELTDMPHAGPARQRMLERAIELQDRFLASSDLGAGDEALRLQRAEAWFERGWMLVTLGKQQLAIRSLDTALERLRPLEASPQIDRLRGRAETWRGQALGQLGEMNDQIEALDRALALFAKHPNAADREQVTLCTTLCKAVIVWVSAGRFKDALPLARQAVELAQSRLAASPESAEWKFQLARARARLGDALAWNGDTEPATKEFEASIQALEALEPSRTSDSELGWARSQWSRQLERLGRFQEMEAQAKGARAIYVRLAARFPAVLAYPFGAANAVELLARSAHRRGAMQVALGYYRETLKMRRHCFDLAPGQSDSVTMLAYAHYGLARATQDRDAATAIEEYAAGIALLEPFLAKRPAEGGAARMLANMSFDIARLHWQAKDNARALAAMDTSVRVFQKVTEVSRNNVDLRRRYAVARTVRSRWRSNDAQGAADDRRVAHAEWRWLADQARATATDLTQVLHTWPPKGSIDAAAWLDARPAVVLTKARTAKRFVAAEVAIRLAASRAHLARGEREAARRVLLNASALNHPDVRAARNELDR